MKGKAGQRVFAVVLLLGSLMTVSAILLPYLKEEQSVVWSGPSVPYGRGNYTISGYLVPPVDAGEPVSISVYGYSPGSVDITVFAAKGGDLVPDGPPIVSYTRLSNSSYTRVVVSNRTASYGILVNSYNGTSFFLRVDSRWSPFYNRLSAYLAAGVFMVLSGAFGAYYFRTVREKERMEEEALAPGTGLATGPPAAVSPAAER